MGDFSALSNLDLWGLVVGFISPPIIAVIQQQRWSDRLRACVAFVFYFASAAVTAWFGGVFNGPDVVRAFLLIFLSAAASYTALWKPTGIAPAIEKATTVPPPRLRHRHRAGEPPNEGLGLLE